MTNTRDMRSPERPTKKIPAEVLRALIEESRSEEEQRVREWEDSEAKTADRTDER